MKRQIQTYSFSPGGAGAGTVTFTNFATIALDRILMVVNITRGTIIFNFADAAKGGTVATNVLTLATSTSGHSSGDALYIVYDDTDQDFDTGAGSDRHQGMGILLPASGGAVLLGQANPMPVLSAPRANKVKQPTTITASTSETTILTAVTSTYLDLYGLILANTSTTGTIATVKDASMGTTQLTLYVPPLATVGFQVPLDAAIPQTTAGSSWTLTSSQSITSLLVTALAVKNT